MNHAMLNTVFSSLHQISTKYDEVRNFGGQYKKIFRRESHQSPLLYGTNPNRNNTKFLDEFYFDFFCYAPLKLHESCYAQY